MVSTTPHEWWQELTKLVLDFVDEINNEVSNSPELEVTKSKVLEATNNAKLLDAVTCHLRESVYQREIQQQRNIKKKKPDGKSGSRKDLNICFTITIHPKM